MYHRNPKNSSLRGLLKNDQMADLIRDAVSSPIGSTSRKRAKSIASILKKAGVFDGVGSPGMGYQNIGSPQPAVMPPDYSRLVVFKSAPAFSPRVLDGQGGPGFDMPSGGTSVFSGVKIPNYNDPTPPTGLTGLTSSGKGTYTPPGAPLLRNNPLSYVRDPARDLTVSVRNMGQVPVLGRTPLTIGTVQPTVPPAQTAPQTTGVVMNGPQPQPQTGVTPTPPPGGGTPKVGGETPAPQTGPLSSLQTLQQSAQGAVKEGTGAASFAYDKAGSLSDKVNELDTTLRKQYDLDNILNQKNSLIKRGITLEGDLSDYIRGRDEYLNQTQGMIDRFTNSMTSMDMGNPVVAKQADNYMNYLYTLRGRQNKRYIDFLNSGINEYNAQLTDVSNYYEKALGAYEHDLTLKTNVTQAEYQMYYNALTDMYNTVDQAPIKKLEMEKLKMEINTGYQRAAIDATKAARSGSGLVEGINKLKGIVWGEDKNDPNKRILLPSVKSIVGTINQYAADGEIDQYSVTSAIVRAMEDSLGGDAGFVLPKARDYMNMIAEYKQQAVDPMTKSDAHEMGRIVTGAMQSSIKQSLSDPNTNSTARDAVNSLVSPGWFGRGKVPSRDEFISSYKENLPSDLLDSMYSIFDQFKKDGGDPKLLFSTNGSLKDTSDSDFASTLAASIAQTELGLLAQY